LSDYAIQSERKENRFDFGDRRHAMTTQDWKISGQYYETCNCDFVCPCLPGQMAVKPSKDSCKFAMAFQIEQGQYGAVPLKDLGFIILGMTPEEMGKGNWSVGLVIDERADDAQRDAIAAIASGTAGGPMAAVSGLVGSFMGTESAPIQFDRVGKTWAVSAAQLVDMAAEAAMGLDANASEPLHFDNTGHPAASRFALARASRSHIHVFGMDWDDASGRNNGQYAPFSWQNA
jgi:hypothetical protein